MSTELDELLMYSKDCKRICPQPHYWNLLWEMLPEKQRASSGWEPKLPLILGAWYQTSNDEKQTRFISHLNWAEQHGSLDKVDVFLRSLKADQWYYSDT